MRNDEFRASEIAKLNEYVRKFGLDNIAVNNLNHRAVLKFVSDFCQQTMFDVNTFCRMLQQYNKNW